MLSPIEFIFFFGGANYVSDSSGVFAGQHRNEAVEKEVVCAVRLVSLLLQR